jgi:membrane associated rhomboid family serine protease
MNNYRSSFLSSIPPVVKNLIAINIILWLASVVAPGLLHRFGVNTELSDILGMHYWASSKFNAAQLITYMFMHAGFEHILFNMFALYMFGGILERLWGPKRFLFYYLVTGIGAAIVQQVFWTVEFHSALTAINHAISTDLVNAQSLIEQKRQFLDSPYFITIGASGAVFGLLLAFGWIFPNQELYVMFIPIPIKAKYFVFFYGIVELFMGVAQFSGDSIAHFAHLGGMLFGAILIIIWKKKRLF